jgi:ParB/RepB/Spo0J family partition protein
LARPDFRAAATARLNEERGQELSQNVLSLLAADETTIIRPSAVRNIPVDRVDPNPNQPRMAMDKAGLDRSDGLRQRARRAAADPGPAAPRGRYQLVAGERRWRAATAAGLGVIPALIEDIDDDTALEIAVIENLQREDLSPLDEAMIYDKMIRQHGYSIRKLAQKLGKDKGYLENRLRLADAPAEIRELVSVRKDTLSHAYELLKSPTPRSARSWPTWSLAASFRWSSFARGSMKHRGPSDRPKPPRRRPAGWARSKTRSEAEADANWVGTGDSAPADGRLADRRPIAAGRRHHRADRGHPVGRDEDHRRHRPRRTWRSI